MRKFRKAPIVIGGCPRSGTSLLLSILSSQPDIYCIPQEAWAFYDTETLVEFERLVDEYLWPHLPNGLETKYARWCEKTPRNVLAFRNILDYFGPECRLIHLVRDGRDVITSRHPHKPDKFWVEDWMWIWYVSEGMKFIAHPQVLTVRYEDLIRTFQETMTEILQFIGEDVIGGLEDWHLRTTVRKHSAWFEEVQPVNDDSIGRWRELQDSEVLKNFLENPKAKDLLRRLNYI